ncbi:MAG: c-type cytochrome [Anaerolineales bacterium]|nr:MAG: c-type cytochrome [Anaerolineales bacterium]
MAATPPDPKQVYKERYEAQKQRGVKFFPDIIYKDMIVAFGIFILLIFLATFIGVKPEPPADPNDSTYIPRPEWYFLFLFQMLKYFPGSMEWVGTAVVPAVAVLALLLLPFYDRSPVRYWRKRKLALGLMSLAVIGIVALTIVAAATTPPQEEFSATGIADEVVLGQDLYSIQCVECHGSEGEGGEIVGVEGLEGVVVAPLNAPDFIYTRTDKTIYNIIDYGQQDLGMPPFGLASGGELQRGEIDAIVTFIRYTWDDRVEIPADALGAGSVPELGPDEIPTYVVHIEPMVRRTCLSCHRPGKENNNYFMGTYDEILNSGDNTPNLTGGLESNLIRMLHREEIDAGGAMPPSRPLREDWVEIFERWILAGMPETPEDLPAPETTDAPDTGASPLPEATVGQPAGETPTP